MGDQPVPRGRGAALLQALKKHQEKIGKQPEEPQVEDEPPKPRGRAALLQKLQESRKQKVGAEDVAQTSTASPPVRPVQVKQVEELTKSIQEVAITEPVSYKGESGKSVHLSANYIRLQVEKDRGVFEYEVRFHPELDAKGRRIKMINSLMSDMGNVKIFDGGSTLYLPKQITDTQLQFQGTLPGPDGDQEITTTIIFKKKKRLGECIHLYNVLFKRIMYILLYSQMGRNYFNPSHKYLIPQHKLEVYPGFAITVDEVEDGLMICLDTQHRVLRTQNAYELLHELRCSDPHRFKSTAQSSIIGACILTKYNNKTYTVDDIGWDMSPEDTFPTRDGRNISFVEYYRSQYNLEIKDVNQPLLINRQPVKVSGSSAKEDRLVCLVPELCYLTGLTDAMRSDFKVMKDVAQYTRITPNQRVQALRKYLENLKNSEKAQQVLNDWGLTVTDGSIDLSGRILENEIIAFGNDKTIRTNESADWNREVGNSRVTMPVDMLKWIVFHTARDQKYAKDFAQSMTRLGDVMGCRISPPKIIQLNDDHSSSYVTACKNYIVREVQIVVFIVPTKRDDRYSVIKQICCTELPIPSQVIISKTLSNPGKVRSIIQKIALQMTCKLGGALWTVRFPFKNWMIIGTDVYHGKNSPSVCGLVASLNESVSKWFSIATFQDKEIGDFYKKAFIKVLEMWKMELGCFPANVVVFRDGVSDGQLEFSRNYEVEQFESVVREFNLDTKLCFVVVQKRISTRMYQIQRDGAVNPNPGTILDHSVTRRHLPDFFLVPQCVRQGTVNPVHYIVLHDSCKLKPDHVQRLTYKLCHLYYNWPGTIRVPAPCQYAHKLAGLVGQNIKKVPNSALCDKLFFL